MPTKSLLLTTALLIGCNIDKDGSGEPEPAAIAPDPIGPKLYETRHDCPEDDPLCWTTTVHRQGQSLQALHFHGYGGPFLFEQRGELTPETSALLDQKLAEVDPSETELVDYAGICHFASHPPTPVYLYIEGVEYEVLRRCPPEGFAALEMLIGDIDHAMDNCDEYQTILTVTDCMLYPLGPTPDQTPSGNSSSSASSIGHGAR